MPDMLLEFFTYKPLTKEAILNLPSCYTRIPWHCRNTLRDERIRDPIEDYYDMDEPMSGDFSPSKSSQSSLDPELSMFHDDAPDTVQRNGGRPPTPTPSDDEESNAVFSQNSQRSLSSEPVVVKRRRARASPTNFARYARPPIDENAKGVVYWPPLPAVAKSPKKTEKKKRRKKSRSLVLDEASDEDADEDNEQVRFASFVSS